MTSLPLVEPAHDETEQHLLLATRAVLNRSGLHRVGEVLAAELRGTALLFVADQGRAQRLLEAAQRVEEQLEVIAEEFGV